jgi:hypothetical protein
MVSRLTRKMLLRNPCWRKKSFRSKLHSICLARITNRNKQMLLFDLFKHMQDAAHARTRLDTCTCMVGHIIIHI